MRKLKVFVSHAKEDIGSAKDLTSRLKLDGFDPWFDEHKLLPGQDWKMEIENAIQEADIVLVCLTNASTNKRGFIQKEIKLALDTAESMPEGEIYCIPARFELCSVPKRLKLFHWVDLFKADGYDKLKTSLLMVASNLDIKVTPEAFTHDITGIYLATGNNAQNEKYEGRVIITSEKENYKIVWNIGAERKESIGIRNGNLLSVKGDYNFTYEIQADNTLFGEWEPGLYEKLIPMPEGF